MLVLMLLMWLMLRLRLLHVASAFVMMLCVSITAMMPVVARRSILRIVIALVASDAGVTGAMSGLQIMKWLAARLTPKRHRTRNAAPEMQEIPSKETRRSWKWERTAQKA